MNAPSTPWRRLEVNICELRPGSDDAARPPPPAEGPRDRHRLRHPHSAHRAAQLLVPLGGPAVPKGPVHLDQLLARHRAHPGDVGAAAHRRRAPLGLLLSTHLLVLILPKASQTTGPLPVPVPVPFLEEQPSAEAEGVSVDEPAEVPVTEAVAAAAAAPAVEPVAVPRPVDVPVAPPAAPPVAQVAAALELAPEAPSAPDVPMASAPAPAAPAAVTPTAAPPRARTVPAAKRAPALTRDEAYGRYVAELEAGRPVTSDDIASWMHLSPVRCTKTLEQFAAQVREAA